MPLNSTNSAVYTLGSGLKKRLVYAKIVTALLIAK
jgi:hypothetical protein